MGFPTAKAAQQAANQKKGSNYDKALEAALKTYDELGKQAGKGDLAVSEGFANAVKFANQDLFKEDQALTAATRLSNARAGAGMGEATDKTIKKNASYFSQGIAAVTQCPAIDFEKTTKQVYVRFDEMKKKGQAKRPLIEAYVAAARAQLKQPTKELTKDQIDECLAPFVKEQKTKTRVEFWLNIQKQIESAHAKGLDRDEEAEMALDAVRDRIASLPDEEIEAFENSKPGKKKKAKKQAKAVNAGIGNTQPNGPDPSPTSTVTNLQTGMQTDKTSAGKVDPINDPTRSKPVGVPSPLGPRKATPLSVPTEDDVAGVIGLISDPNLLRQLRALGFKA